MKPIEELVVRRYASAGRVPDETTRIAVETAMTIDIDGAFTTTTMCTPSELRALAVGFLLTEGHIGSVDDIAALAECPDDPLVIRVRLLGEKRAPTPERRGALVLSSCGLCGRDEIERRIAAAVPVESTMTVPARHLSDAMGAMREKQAIFEQCRGTHAALIFDAAGDEVGFAEDVGRHNALDKALGKALLARRSPKGSGVALSGRVSFEMVHKCAMAGIEIISAVSAPTTLAIEAAERCGITLCALVRGDDATVYTHPHRIR